MHKHTASQDSAYHIRTNPLNIVMGDGSDLVMPRKHLYETFESYRDTKNTNTSDLSDVLSMPQNESNSSDSDDTSFTFDSSYTKRPRPFSSICVSKSVTSALTTANVPAPEKAEFVAAPDVPRRSQLRPKSEVFDQTEATELASKFSENRHFGNEGSMEKRLLAAEAHMMESHDSLELPQSLPQRDMAAEIASLSISNGTCKVLPKVSSSTSLARDRSVNPFSDLTKRVYHLQPVGRTLDPNSPTREAFFDDEEVEEGKTMDGEMDEGVDTPQTSGSDFEGSTEEYNSTESAESLATQSGSLSTGSEGLSGSTDTVAESSTADVGNDSLLSLSIDSKPLDFSGFGLSRKNTITSSGGSLSSCRPSESSGAFKKLKSARSKFGSMKKSDLEKQKRIVEQKEKEWLEQQQKEQQKKEQQKKEQQKQPVSVFESDSEFGTTPDIADDSASVLSEATTTSFHSANSANTHTLDPNARASVLSPPTPPSPIEESFDMHIMQQLTQMPTPEFNKMMESPALGALPGQQVKPVKPVEQVKAVAPVKPVERPMSRDSVATAVSTAVSTKTAASVASAAPSTAASTASTAASNVSAAPVAPAIDAHDRGRLFMAIRGIKDIRLPIDHTRHPKYTLTLDNGIQCVTTEPMDLRSSAKIEQEFELIVGDDLELVFTLKAGMDPLVRSMVDVEEVEEKQEDKRDKRSRDKSPKSPLKSALKSRDASPEKSRDPSPAKEETPATPTTPKKLSKGKSFKALFSPRKKKQQPAVEPIKEDHVTIEPVPEPVKKHVTHAPAPVSKAPKHIRYPDLWDHIVSSTGSFARCYIVESQYESEIFGRSRTYSIPLYNEWGQEKIEGKDSRDQKTHTWKRQEPYRIGCLEITLMYIPRVSRYDRLPSSMQACHDELAAAKTCQEMRMEGFLSQEGGDCAYWRRRWFKLEGHVLRGFHEDTMKERCVFDLSHVTDILELGNPKSRSSKSQIHSGLVGGYVLVEGAFRVTFADNTFVNFYAENDAEKAKWVSILSVAMQHVPGKNVTWTDLVFEQHKKEAESSAKISQGWNVERSGFMEGHV